MIPVLADLVVAWVNKNRSKLGPSKEFAGKTIQLKVRAYHQGVRIEATVTEDAPIALESVYE